MNPHETKTSPDEGLEMVVKQKWQELSPEMRIYYIELFLLAAVQIIDAVTYANAIQVPGANEINPVIARVAEQLGLTGFLTLKSLAAVTLFLMMELTRNKLNHGRTSPFINNSLRILNTLYAIVCANNAAYPFLPR